MSTAYRLPRGMFQDADASSRRLLKPNEPITTMVTNSLITSLAFGQQVPRGKPSTSRGSPGTAAAASSASTCRPTAATRGRPRASARTYGRFSFRDFSHAVPTAIAGRDGRDGAGDEPQPDETQVERLMHNPAGYHHNVIQRLYVEIV